MVEKISYLLLFGWFEHIKKVSLHPAIQKWACSPPLDGDRTTVSRIRQYLSFSAVPAAQLNGTIRK